MTAPAKETRLRWTEGALIPAMVNIVDQDPKLPCPAGRSHPWTVKNDERDGMFGAEQGGVLLWP